MRFRDIRQTVIKRTDEAPTDLRATAQFLSPYRADRRTPRPGVHPADILQPMHNRASRRQLGIVRSRRRLGGVALVEKPWHIVEGEDEL